MWLDVDTQTHFQVVNEKTVIRTLTEEQLYLYIVGYITEVHCYMCNFFH